jgi:C4-type Zn-finger protein
MDVQTIKTGTCPVCGSNEVYTDRTSVKRGERMIIPITGWSRIFLDVYVCISCGYFKEFIPEKVLKDEKKIEKIKSNWKRVK